MNKTPFFLIAALMLSGCATTHNITPQYINPNNYLTYDCSFLQNEVSRITTLAKATQHQQTPLTMNGIGIGITGGRHGIYPSISLGIGSGTANRHARTNQLARLYGEHDAMVVAARQKSCAFAQNINIYGEN
ncbi:hypothetical protein [Moraxella oculi]|uniref:Lipoprotein n=1 Tax=Moraxella oculi TaxID=2940516 RepID=A0ABW8UA66_9GAMM